MAKRTLTGINIQFPISQLIIDGSKVIETRTYPIPSHLIGKELAIVETPGKKGNFSARIIGTVIFKESFLYKNESEFYKDQDLHFVTKNSIWKWKPEKPKWGWVIQKVTKFKQPLSPPKKRGIVYTKNIEL